MRFNEKIRGIISKKEILKIKKGKDKKQENVPKMKKKITKKYVQSVD